MIYSLEEITKSLLSQFDKQTIKKIMNDVLDDVLDDEKAIIKKTSEFPEPNAALNSANNVVDYDQYKNNNFAERVIADSNELPIYFLEKGATLQKSVARVHMEDGFGTGFLISSSILMTNNHVIPTKDVAQTAQIEFNFQMDLQGNPLPVDVYTTDPNDLFYTSSQDQLDYTIIRLKDRSGPAGNKWGFCKIREVPIAPKQYCNIIQHPQGGYKQVALQENHIVKVFEHKIRYTTDTEPGSSGSPVFDNSWRLIALHHSAGEQDHQTGNWIDNEGINIASIRTDIVNHFQSEQNGLKIIDELGLNS